MDNQQERPLGLEFVGGLAVGEGSFYLAVLRVKDRGGTKRANASSGYRITPGFRIQMNDLVTLETAADILRQHGLPVHLSERKHACRYVLTALGAKRVKRYVEALTPFLTGTKLEAATTVGEFIDSRLSRPYGASYTEEEVGLVEKLRSINGNTNGRKTPLGILRGHTSDIR